MNEIYIAFILLEVISSALLFTSGKAVSDLFLSEYSSKSSNFADDCTPYEYSKNYDEIINKLEDTIEKIFNWFQCNSFKANESKCHFFLSPFKMHLNVIFSSHRL